MHYLSKIIRHIFQNANIEDLPYLTKFGIINMVYKFVYTGTMFLTSVVLTRFMGLENYGIYSYAYAIVMILVLPSHFGSPILIVREVSRSMESQDWSLIRGILQWTAKFSCMLSILIIAVFWGVTSFFPFTIDPEIQGVLLIGVFYIPFFSLSINIGGVLRGFHKIGLGQLPEQILIPILFLGVVIVNDIFGITKLVPQSAMVFHVISVFLTLIISVTLLSLVIPKFVVKAKPVRDGRRWLHSMFALATITSMRLINKWVGLLILGLFVSSAEVGIFRIAVQMSVLADIGIQIINPVVSPQLARLFAKNKIDQIQNIAILTARIAFVINLVVTIVFLLFGHGFILYFYGPEYQASFVVLMILLVGQIFNSLVGPVANLLNMTGHEKDTAKGRVITTALNVGLNFVLCPSLGIIGTAIASSFASIVWNVLLFGLAKTKINIRSFVFAQMIRKENSGNF